MNISPYLWMAGMNGTLSLGGHEAQVKQSFGDIFSNLKFGLMGLTEVRRGRIGILTDLMWVRLGDETSIPLQSLPTGVTLKTSINTFTFTPWLAYRLFGNNRASVDMLTGGRYYHLYGKITADAGSVGQLSYSGANNWADFVEGGRIMFNVTPRVGAFVIGDAGGGGSDLTWQVAGGLGYRWTKRWSTQLGYPRLYFDRSDNKLGIQQTQQGLLLGATFRWR
jgi:hypothetical protein